MLHGSDHLGDRNHNLTHLVIFLKWKRLVGKVLLDEGLVREGQGYMLMLHYLRLGVRCLI